MKRFENILLVFDPERNDDATVSLAISLAGRNHSGLTLISVVEDLPPEAGTWNAVHSIEGLRERVIKDRRDQLQALIESIRAAGIKTRALVLPGTPFLEIIRQVLRDQHDLVMVTAEGADGLKEQLFGSTTMHLMRKCPCPIWAIKPKSHKSFARILAAVDPDSPAIKHNALDRLVMDLACSLASLEQSELHIVHAWNLPGEEQIRNRGVILQDELDMWLRGVRSRRQNQLDDLLGHYSSLDLNPRIHLIQGRPGKIIPSLIREKEIDLLVMGTVCRTGVSGFFIGNTAETVLAQVDCSVLSVKPEQFLTPVTLEN